MHLFENTDLCVERGGAQGLARPVLVDYAIHKNMVPPDHIVLHVDKFGFSANNITYGMLGENPHFNYFDFYPARPTAATSPVTHGIIPVWGFGTVIVSTHATIKVGQRLYGYLAMSKYLIIPLDKQTNKYSVNIALGDFPKDRRPYKQLTICETDPMYRVDREDETMLYRPLFWTSYWFEDYLNENKYRDATHILISSASSKTSFTLAYNIQRRKARSAGKLKIRVVGITSASNAAFTKRLGLFDQVLTYNDVTTLSPSDKWIYTDVSGNQSLNASIASHLRPLLTVALGMTSVESGDASSLKGREHNTSSHESFFMPEWLAIRVKQLSASTVVGMQKDAWAALMEDCTKWVRMERTNGADAVVSAYKRVLEGGVAPDSGLVFSLWDEVRAKL